MYCKISGKCRHRKTYIIDFTRYHYKKTHSLPIQNIFL